MANKHKTLQSLFTEIAKSIRACKQSTDPIVADDFPEAILELDTAGATAGEADILEGKTAWVDGKLVTGTCTYDADTDDADATSREVCMDKVAYVKGEKVTGDGLIYKKVTLTDWYGTYQPSGSLGGKYIRLLSCSNKYTILAGWANFVSGSKTTQIRFSGAGDSDNFKGDNSTANNGIYYYNGYGILWVSNSNATSIGTIDSIEVELYYRQF